MRRRVTLLLAIAGALALAVASFEWNWLRAPLASYVSAQLGRPVAIEGDLHVELSTQPLVIAEGVSLANASWSEQPIMGRASRVAVRVDPLSIFSARLALPEVRLTEPHLVLERDADGNGNWPFTREDPIPLIGALAIEDGVVHYREPAVGTEVTVRVASSATDEGGRKPVTFSGTGSLRRHSFIVEGRAASLLALEAGERPYLLEVHARSNGTDAWFDGRVIPNRIDNVDGALTLQGRDLSQLYPIIPVPFPWTPPYKVNGRLAHDGKTWTFRDFSGRVGASDVAGTLALSGHRRRERPMIEGEIVSQRLNLSDLGGIVGLPPDAARPRERTLAQQVEAKRRAASSRVLPAKPYQLQQFRVADANIRLQGRQVLGAASVPLERLNAGIHLEDGVLTLKPLDFGLAGGQVASTIILDARGSPIRMRADATAKNVELKHLLPNAKPPNGSAGKVGGQVRLAGVGNSVADMLATSNGDVALVSRGGDASELAIVLTNLDLAHAAELLLTGDRNVPIHCLVADFAADNGRLEARNLVMDTSAEKIVGDGSVDLAQERYALTLEAKSKKPSLVALRGPIVVEGTFKSPKVHPAVLPVAARVGSSIALGTLLSPLAALLPLVDMGGGEDADCRGLIEEARQNVRAKPPLPKAATRNYASTPSPASIR